MNSWYDNFPYVYFTSKPHKTILSNALQYYPLIPLSLPEWMIDFSVWRYSTYSVTTKTKNTHKKSWCIKNKTISIFVVPNFNFFLFVRLYAYLEKIFIVVQAHLAAFSPHCPSYPYLPPLIPPTPLVLPMWCLYVFLKPLPLPPPISPPTSSLVTVSLFLISMFWLFISCLFVLLIRLYLQVRSYVIFPSLTGLFHLE